jgi:hypothetical protein
MALMLGGCGEASPESASQAAPNTTTIRLESPAVQTNGLIVPDVACGAGTIWLPLKWGQPPKGTEELVLYFGRFEEKAGDPRSVAVSFAAIITGISPELRGMAANTFPPGSEYKYFVSLKNCPPVREGQHFLVELFALDGARGVPQDDDFATRLAEEALRVEQPVTSSPAAEDFRDEALGVGQFTAVYGPE